MKGEGVDPTPLQVAAAAKKNIFLYDPYYIDYNLILISEIVIQF